MAREMSEGKLREHDPFWKQEQVGLTTVTYTGDGTTTGTTVPIEGEPDVVHVVEDGTSTEYTVDETGSLVTDATDGVTESTSVKLNADSNLVVGDGSTDGNVNGTDYTLIGIDVGLL